MQDALGLALAARCGDVLAACICTNLRMAARVATQRFDRTLEPCGLRAAQLSLLLACAASGDGTAADIAERLSIDRTTLSRTLRALAQRGLLEIDRAPNRRARRITVTDHGRAALSAALTLWAAAERSTAEQLGWDELGRLLPLLTRITAHANQS